MGKRAAAATRFAPCLDGRGRGPKVYIVPNRSCLPLMAPRRPLSHWLLLGALVAMWGSSFLFTKIAVEALAPSTIVAARLAIGAAVLLALMLALGRRLPRSPRAWGFFLAMAVTGNALPFFLITWGQQGIDSGVAGILMAVMPLATLLLAHYLVSGERMTALRGLGFLLGFGGIVVLVGPATLLKLEGAGGALVSQLAVLGGALCYALNTIIARHRPPDDPLVAAAGVMMLAVVVSAPALGPRVALPAELPLVPALAVAVLGLFSTALATIGYLKLVTLAGPTFVSMINYLIPPWAVLLGAVVLGERPRRVGLGRARADPVRHRAGRARPAEIVGHCPRRLVSILEHAVPIEVVAPAFVQEVGREGAAVALQLVGGRLLGPAQRVHVAFPRQAVGLPEIAALTGGDHVVPGGSPAARARDHVIEGQLLGAMVLAAVLAVEQVAQEDIEAGEGRPAVQVDVFLERDDAGQAHLEARRAHHAVVLRDDIDPLQEHGLDRVLPRPDRQGKVAQGPKIGVEHQGRKPVGRGHNVRAPPACLKRYDTLLAPPRQGLDSRAAVQAQDIA